VSTLLPLADATLRSLRHGDGVIRALNVDIGRHLLIVTVPCNDWADVRQTEQYVMERLEFAGPPDRQCIGVYFSGYRPDPGNREERVLAIKIGAVAGGWDAVYEAILGTPPIAHDSSERRVNGVAHERRIAVTDRAGGGWEGIS
jgi:hypothetical protein